MKPCKIKYFPLQRGIINFRRINFISNSKQYTKGISTGGKACETTNILERQQSTWFSVVSSTFTIITKTI